MRLTARSEYGLLAMVEIAASGTRPVSARLISEHQNIPIKFLEQLLVALRRADLVTAIRGARGGFVLAGASSAITVLDIVEALEGPMVAPRCESDRGATCGRAGHCAAAVVWHRATEALKAVFADTTLAELVTYQHEIDETKVH